MLVGIFWIQNSFSQMLTPEVYASSGDYFTAANGSLSWTLGECVMETYTNTNNILTQGFQQSEYLITSIKENSDVLIPVCIYPNPTMGLLNIHSDVLDKKELKVEMYDASGRLIHSAFLHDDIILNLSDFKNCEYFIKVSDTSRNSVNTFKLIKTN
jgi:hypothetical protein